jgi:hypothetical protein
MELRKCYKEQENNSNKEKKKIYLKTEPFIRSNRKILTSEANQLEDEMARRYHK